MLGVSWGLAPAWAAIGERLATHAPRGHTQTKRLSEGSATDWHRLGAGAGGWAVVTGASMGMGREYALQLAARGLHVVLIADPGTRAELEAVAAQITTGGAVRAVAIAEDLLDPAAFERVAATLRPLAADVSVLVNHVGLAPLGRLGAVELAALGEALCGDPAASLRVVRRLTAPMEALTQLLLPHMRAAALGRRNRPPVDDGVSGLCEGGAPFVRRAVVATVLGPDITAGGACGGPMRRLCAATEVFIQQYTRQLRRHLATERRAPPTAGGADSPTAIMGPSESNDDDGGSVEVLCGHDAMHYFMSR